MVVVEIEKLKSRKNKIILDTGENLYLYNSEIKKLGLDIESEIDEEFYQMIMEEFIYTRAKKKALAILERSMNSVYQVRSKLKRADYPESIIDKVVEFLEYYNFVDDILYSKMYIEANQSRKSKLELKIELKKRGIDSELIKEAFDDIGDEAELEAIKKFIRKYQDAQGNIPEEKKMKVLSALYRKGFSRDLISKIIETDDVS